jgi:DNA-binding transcriptional ArsR family regulator
MQRSRSNLGPTHDAVLNRIAANPNCTAGDLSDALMLTRRTIWGVIGDLRRAGIVHVRRRGRRHHYSVNLNAPLGHPAKAGSMMGQVLAGVKS